MDCSGGNVISEDAGFERKAAALERILKEQVRTRRSAPLPLCPKKSTA